jgi:uncharacterized protein YdaU (DUF1376 family)
MTDLYYFPLLVADWLSGEAVSMMTPEQEGAFNHLICHAWRAKGVPCSLPNDDKALAQLSRLGKRWKAVGAYVREQFQPIEGDPTRLRNAKLYAVYVESVAKHEARVRSGKAGGDAKAKGQQGSSNATAIPEQGSSSHNHSHNHKELTTQDDPDVDRVLARYQQLQPLRKIVGAKPRGFVERGLKNFSADEVIEAIEGNAADPWCIEKGKHELSYILRDAEMISHFILRKQKALAPERLVGVGGDLSDAELKSMGIRL